MPRLICTSVKWIIKFERISLKEGSRNGLIDIIQCWTDEICGGCEEQHFL